MNIKSKMGLLSLCLGMLFFAGCNKENSILSAKMSATIDGKSWNSTARVVSKNSSGFVITATQISTSFITSTLVVTIKGSKTGTYNLSIQPMESNCLAAYTPNVKTPLTSYASTSGTVTISEINTDEKTISGTFNFSCTNSTLVPITISNGTFTGIKYTETSIK